VKIVPISLGLVMYERANGEVGKEQIANKVGMTPVCATSRKTCNYNIIMYSFFG